MASLVAHKAAHRALRTRAHALNCIVICQPLADDTRRDEYALMSAVTGAVLGRLTAERAGLHDVDLDAFFAGLA